MTLELCMNVATKIEPLLLLSKNAKGAAAAKLIADATAAPGVFTFAELLELPNVQELANTSHASHLELLRLFAYGTYEDYLTMKSSLPALNEKQITKLRLLTIVSHSMTHRILPYDLILKSLQVPTIRELEDLIIDGIYADLIRGKLDQKEQQFEVEVTVGRDIEPRKYQTLLESLRDWSQTTSSILATLDAQLAQLSAQEAASKQAQEEHDRNVQEVLADVAEKAKERSGRSGRGDDMEVDDPRVGFVGADGGKPSRKMKMSTGDKPASRKRNKF